MKPDLKILTKSATYMYCVSCFLYGLRLCDIMWVFWGVGLFLGHFSGRGKFEFGTLYHRMVNQILCLPRRNVLSFTSIGVKFGYTCSLPSQTESETSATYYLYHGLNNIAQTQTEQSRISISHGHQPYVTTTSMI